MNTLRTLCVIVQLVLGVTGVAVAKDYSGAGETPAAALEEAIKNAEKHSIAHCVCKGADLDVEKICRKSKWGGFSCTVCGSRNAGSCEKSHNVLDDAISAAKKIKDVAK